MKTGRACRACGKVTSPAHNARSCPDRNVKPDNVPAPAAELEQRAERAIAPVDRGSDRRAAVLAGSGGPPPIRVATAPSAAPTFGVLAEGARERREQLLRQAEAKRQREQQPRPRPADISRRIAEEATRKGRSSRPTPAAPVVDDEDDSPPPPRSPSFRSPSPRSTSTTTPST